MGNRHVASFLAQCAADDAHGLTAWFSPKRLFLKLGFFHHPVGKATQEFQLRTATFETAIP